MLQGYLEADCRSSLRNSMYPLFPNGLSGIFFNFGSPGKLILEKEYTTQPVSIFGQIDQRFAAVDAPGFYSLGVLFKPTVLSKFLRVDMSELTNKAVDGLLLRSDLLDVHEKLQYEKTTQARICVLDHYFSKTLFGLSTQTFIGDHAVQLINTQGNITIEKIADQLRITQRYLEISFKRSVGISPKSYSLIQRFNRTAQRLRAGSSNVYPLSFGDEYYDQMHLIKTFKRFTGYTPSQYLRENLEMGRSYLVG